MRTLRALMLVAGAAAAAAAQSGTTTTTIPITATLLSTCSASATALAFNVYTPGAGAIANNGTISVKCTKSTAFTVALNGGTTTGGTVAQRLMANGSNHLQYNLYTSATFATVFGDGTGSSQTEAGTGAGLATAAALTVYGQLPDNATNQVAVPGSYSDLITVTVSY